jgi:DNA-binding transcriptional MerR regulator
MALTDAALLDIVRRLRSYVVTVDNIHFILDSLKEIDDVTIVKQTMELSEQAPIVNTKVSQLLRQIENSKTYRNMLHKFNLEHTEDKGDTDV